MKLKRILSLIPVFLRLIWQRMVTIFIPERINFSAQSLKKTESESLFFKDRFNIISIDTNESWNIL